MGCGSILRRVNMIRDMSGVQKHMIKLIISYFIYLETVVLERKRMNRREEEERLILSLVRYT